MYNKIEVIEAIKSKTITLREIDKTLLRDRDVVIAYMEVNSSNRIIGLDSHFPINIDVEGMIDNQDFIMQVIKNIDTCYNKNDLADVLKVSTMRIINKKLKDKEIINRDEARKFAEHILNSYKLAVDVRNEELEQRNDVYSSVCDYVKGAEILSDLEQDETIISRRIGELMDVVLKYLPINEQDAEKINLIRDELKRDDDLRRRHNEQQERKLLDLEESVKQYKRKSTTRQIGFASNYDDGITE